MRERFVDVLLEYAIRASEAEYQLAMTDPRDDAEAETHRANAAHYHRCLRRVRVLIDASEDRRGSVDGSPDVALDGPGDIGFGRSLRH